MAGANPGLGCVVLLERHAEWEAMPDIEADDDAVAHLMHGSEELTNLLLEHEVFCFLRKALAIFAAELDLADDGGGGSNTGSPPLTTSPSMRPK